jgi:hypothetical protein
LRESERREYLIVSLRRKEENEPEHPELEPPDEPIDINDPRLMTEEIEIKRSAGCLGSAGNPESEVSYCISWREMIYFMIWKESSRAGFEAISKRRFGSCPSQY